MNLGDCFSGSLAKPASLGRQRQICGDLEPRNLNFNQKRAFTSSIERTSMNFQDEVQHRVDGPVAAAVLYTKFLHSDLPVLFPYPMIYPGKLNSSQLWPYVLTNT